MSGKFETWLFGKWGPLEKSVRNWTRDVLWPEGAFCCACGRVTDGGGLCAACRESLLHDGVFLAWERTDPAPDLPAWSLRPHDGVPRDLILRLKYGAEARAARLLAELLLPLPPARPGRRPRPSPGGNLRGEALPALPPAPAPSGQAGKAPGHPHRGAARREPCRRFPAEGIHCFPRAHR